MLADLLSMIGDLSRYYQDRQANEAFLITAQERANVIRHLLAIGYILSTASPATTSLTFTIPAQTSSVVIDQGDAVTTQDGSVRFEATARLEIPAGSTSGSVDGIEGETVNEDVATADGTANQSYLLGQVPFIFGSETITIDGAAWTRVVNFLSSTGSAQVYTVAVDAFDTATVAFGDGVNGAVAPQNGKIAASYRIGGGIIGNVEAASLTKLGKSYQNANGGSVNMTVTNAAAATGGADRETSEHGKLFGPKSLSTLTRSVARPDFETNAELVPGVARALAQTVEDDVAIDENTTFVQIVPTGSGVPSLTLLDAVKTMLTVTKPKTNTSRLMVAPAVYVDFAPVGTVFVGRVVDGQSLTQAALEKVGDAVLANLVAYFTATNIDITSGKFTIDFGKLIALSRFYRLIEAAAGESYVDITSPAADTTIAKKAFPRLRSYTKSIVAGPPILVQYTWAGLGTTLTVREEP